MAIPVSRRQHEPARALAPSEFLKELSAELASGDLRLPSFPDIAQRVQQAVEDPRATPAQVARVIGSDAALAVRILRLANSAFLNPSAKPKALDITGTEGPNKGKTILAIYERNGDTLRICYDLSGKSRPAEFKTTAGTQLFLVEYKRHSP